ncbi:MAG TPA: ATP-binding protein, partial [Nevskia sp.]|nr:ATP-binding protein [Nevskia sp.]
DETLQRLVFDLGTGQWNSPALRRALEEVVSHDATFDGFEVRHDFGELGRRIMLLNARRLRQEAGRKLLILLSIQDITDSHALQESQQKLELAVKAEHRVNEFLAMLAHELRNPLAPLRTGLQLLKQPGIDAERSLQVRELMERQVGVMAQLIDDLLDAARIAQDKIKLHRKTADLNAIVAQAADAARVLLDSRRQELSVQLHSQPIFVEADPTRLEQILSNLLHNASKFTQHGGRIRLEVALEDDPIDARARHQARVIVRDNGMGIDPETLSHMFELFTQGERSLERAQGGLGIGLTLARKLAQLHGGTLEGKSAGPGQGSEFVLRLPVAPKTPDSSPAPESENKPHAVHRVLIVEDNADTARSLQMALGLAGHHVRVVDHGAAAMEAALQFEPEIVVCDVGLPGFSGYEVARQLRGNPKTAHALLIAVTGYGREEDRRLAREAGFDHHLTKPMDLAQLRRLFERPAAKSESK